VDLTADIVGALIVTYLVSRAALYPLRGKPKKLATLAIVHVCSFLVIALTLGLLKANSYYPFSADAGLIYLLPQIFWFAVDLARFTKKRSHAR